ncbi:MAG: nucleoside hydrolase [Candidatus Bathyarchaeota archaeon]|jgi:inosine-uridine nucleoside N-ribohydrolase
MKHVLIDTDPGVDDALALLLAFSSPELMVEGLTIVAGNVDMDLGSKNALKLLEFMEVRGVPVAPGASKPLSWRGRDASSVHGRTGLGGASLPDPKTSLDPRTAVELILEEADELGSDLTLVAIGPLTNIAEAIMKRQGIVEQVAGLVIMGGAYSLTQYGHGNVTPVAEFNIWHDPEAAKIVFDSGIPTTAVGLDITTDPRNRLSNQRFMEIETLGTRRANIVVDLCKPIIERYDGVNLHDPLAIAALVDTSLIETERFKVEVETRGEVTRGMTIVDRRRYHKAEVEMANVDVGVSVEEERFQRMFSDRVVHGG